jgi:uncharacterized protein YabE (DUF348 family)
MRAYYRLLNYRGVWWAGAAFVALVTLMLLLAPRPTHAENSRVISIFHDGIQQTVVTDAQTVEEALKRADVTLQEHDSVEPGRDTKLTAPAYDLNVYRARPVTVVDGAKRYEVMSPHTSARQIVADAGLTLHNEDKYELTRIDDFLAEGGVGLKLTIDRSVQLNFVLYGKAASIRTQADTVGDLLREKGVVLGAEDGTNMPSDAAIAAGMTVDIWRNGVQTVTEEQEVAFTTEFIRSTDKPVGFREVQTVGKKGKKLVTYQVDLKNGQTLAKKEIQSVVTEQPSKQVEVIGVQTGFTGAFQEALAKLRSCESGGNYANKRNPTYRGAYQFSYSTWANFGGFYDPADAPPEVQDQAAHILYNRRGWQPWPACSQKLGLQDIYR